MTLCSIETITALLIRQSWATPTTLQAEAIARKLSVAAIDNPIYPNPFFVVEPDGQPRCHYLGGARFVRQENYQNASVF